MELKDYTKFHKSLYKLWLQRKYCDVDLICDDGKTRILAHRLVLDACSPYFAAQTANFNENTCMDEITVRTVDGSTLHILVEACYSGSLEVAEEDIPRVFLAAVDLQLNDLIIVLDDHIVQLLNSSNSERFLKLAETCLRSMLIDQIKIRHKLLKEHQEYVFPYASVETECEKLIVVTSDQINGKIMEYSVKQQKWNILTLLPQRTLNRLTVTHSMALNSLCFLGGAVNGSVVTDVLLWNLQTHQLTKMTNMTYARHWPAVVSCNDQGVTFGDLIVIGGWNGYGPMTSMEHWSYKTDEWYSLIPVPLKRYQARLVIDGYRLYCIGGNDDKKNMTSVHCYDLNTHRWTNSASLRHARSNFGVMMNPDGKLYVIGGGSKVIECYNPHNDVWIEVCTVQDSKNVTTCVRHNNHLLAFATDKILISDGDWKVWKQCHTIEHIRKDCIIEAFTIKLK